jgi:hypothetical protein
MKITETQENIDDILYNVISLEIDDYAVYEPSDYIKSGYYKVIVKIKTFP